MSTFVPIFTKFLQAILRYWAYKTWMDRQTDRQPKTLCLWLQLLREKIFSKVLPHFDSFQINTNTNPHLRHYQGQDWACVYHFIWNWYVCPCVVSLSVSLCVCCTASLSLYICVHVCLRRCGSSISAGMCLLISWKLQLCPHAHACSSGRQLLRHAWGCGQEKPVFYGTYCTKLCRCSKGAINRRCW